MATTVSPVSETCLTAKRAARVLARADTAVKDAALEAIATALEVRLGEILAANERDLELAHEAGIGGARGGGAGRSRRRGDRRAPAPQRARRPQGARAAGRGGGGL